MTPRGDGPEGAVRLDVLGRIGLRTHEEELRAVLVQPKRFALLVHLALRRPGGFVRRDELLGTFWPESTEDRARAALRQALRFLRSELGPGVVVNRGRTDVGTEPDALACDALDFLRALEEGDDEAAVERYGGDLLPGFLLGGVIEFERWLEGERQRLRTRAVEAALRLADRAEEEGEPGRAAERVRWALRLVPTDEAVGRRLISLLARDGNRAAAVAAYESLADRLRRALDLEPSPETADLFAAVSAGGEAPAPAAAGAPGESRLSSRRVLVLDLEDRTGDADLGAIGRLAAESVAQGLSTIAEIEVVPPMAVGAAASALHGPDGEPELDARGVPEALAELARRTGAGTVVDGSIHLDGDRLRFQAQITDVADGRLLRGPDPVATPRAAPLDGVERLRERVMATLGPALTRRAVHVREAARPPGIEAYRAYLEGLEHFIRGEWRSALTFFRRSADLEPGYALPRIVCSIALWNLGELAEARATAADAAALRDSVGRFERAVLDMVLAWLRGDWAAAHAAAAVQAELAPGSIPHFQVAEEARRLNRPREAREVLARLDPGSGELRGWIFYWIEMTTAHHLIGDHRRELELASRCRQIHPDEPVAVLLEIRGLAALGRGAAVDRIVERALASPATREPSPGALLLEAGLELRAHGSDDTADPMLERAVEWHRERAGDDAPATLRRELARALYHAGRLDEARPIFEELARTSGGGVQPIGHHHGHLQAHLDEGYLAVIAARDGDGDATSRWRSRLEELDRPFLYGAQWFWLAAMAAVRGDEVRAVRMLRRAFADGLPMEMSVHTDPHLARLRGHAPFDALMRPHG